MTLQYQKEALENASANTTVFKIMSDAGKALKKTHNNLDIDKVEEVMDEVFSIRCIQFLEFFLI